MDAIIQKAIAHNEATKRTSVPWAADEPYPQPYFIFSESKQNWEAVTTGTPSSTSNGSGFTNLALYAWNIDFMLPFAEERMEAALSTLQDQLGQILSSTAIVIYVQECIHSDLETIAKQPWVRERFAITDLNGDNWASGYYGTTTLIDRRLLVTGLFRVHYEKTRMERDAFFIDVLIGKNQDKKVRLCNTHLESLDLMPPYRPPQVQLVSRYLKEDGIHAGVAAGDFNAIQDFDRTLHSDNKLKDAYLVLNGKEDSDEGYTWGQQAATFLRDKFGCSRMDKVYFCGGVKLKSFERFGADVQLTDQKQREHIVGLGFDKPWITDHLGVKAEFEINDKAQTNL